MESSLGATLLEVQDWESTFDPTWYLLARMATPLMDERLAAQELQVHSQEASIAQKNMTWLRGVHNGSTIDSNIQTLLRADYLLSSRDPLPCTSLKLTRSAQSHRKLLMDTREVIGEDSKNVERDVKQLARFLARIPTDFGMVQSTYK